MELSQHSCAQDKKKPLIVQQQEFNWKGKKSWEETQGRPQLEPALITRQTRISPSMTTLTIDAITAEAWFQPGMCLAFLIWIALFSPNVAIMIQDIESISAQEFGNKLTH